jgi:DNA polymerase I-like protein with 3'-5' exonuclease and polymerase domains
MKRITITFRGKIYGIKYYNYSTEAELVLKDLKNKKYTLLWGLDIETSKKVNYEDYPSAGLAPYLSAPRLIQLYDGKNIVYVIDMYKADFYKTADLFPWFKSQKFIAHNAVFELMHMQVAGFKDLEVGCSMILGILIDRAERSPFEADEEPTYRGYSLKALCNKYLKIDLPKAEQTSNWNAPKLTKKQLAYAAVDAIACYRLGTKLIKKVKKYKMLQTYKLFKKMQHVTVEMQLQGMHVNVEKHDSLISEWTKESELAKKACESHFGEINLNSSKQLGKWLEGNSYYKKLREKWPKTPTGAYSFSQAQLADFTHLAAIKSLLVYKKYSKLLSTYGVPLRKNLNPITNRYHSQFNLAAVRTGRLSSSKPNLQNMPREEALRDMFDLNHTDRSYVVADLNQIEMRVAGEISKDSTIREAYRKGTDLHTLMAQTITGKTKVTDEERRLAKAANFGFLFGMGAPKFVSNVKATYGITISEDEGYRVKDNFYNLYSGYIAWCNRQRIQCKKLGFVRTPLGRMRRLLPDEVYTKAINTPVQGGAAEVFFIGMLLLKKELAMYSGQARLANCVHDEILVECRDSIAPEVSRMVERCLVKGMLRLFPRAPVNNLVKAKIGKTWGEAK